MWADRRLVKCLLELRHHLSSPVYVAFRQAALEALERSDQVWSLLARRAGESGGTYPCAYNAANEIAVQAFLAGRIPFLGLAGVVEETLAGVEGAPAGDLDELVEADSAARRLAERAAGALVT